MAASGKIREVIKCSHGKNLGALNLALRSLVGTCEVEATLPLYEQSATRSKLSPMLIRKGS